MCTVAVVGVGAWGRNLVRVFDAEADVRVCCHAGAPETRRWIDEHAPAATVTTDYGAVLDSDVDAVVVATPIDSHAGLVDRALRANKHVFVEKPLGPTREGAADAAALARERDLAVFVGYLFVHHPLFGRVADLVDEGVDSLRLAWNYAGGFETDLLADYVCHPVSVTTALLGGRPDAVTVRSGRDVTDAPGPDALSLALTYGDVDCEVRVSRLSPREASTRLSLVTDDGECYLWDDTVVRRLDDGAFHTVASAETEPLAAECRAFRAAVATGAPPRTDADFAVAVHETLADVEQAWRTNV